uniref:RING-type domain-containing protein n=1 Tax=Parastrongyloides trichosuri TaxID=131310 RepID=A0A0N4ZXZ5_PARTI
MCFVRFCFPRISFLKLCCFCFFCKNICGYIAEGPAHDLLARKRREKRKRENKIKKDLDETPPSDIINFWCVSCKSTETWRIVLRTCKHPVCIYCILNYIRYWIQERSRSAILCPKRLCCSDIHPNDIYALLDEDNEDMDMFMPKENRQWLLFKYERDNYWNGLGGEGNVRQCPICLNAYQRWPGCKYVQCVFPPCRTWFCFECGLPIDTLQHYTQHACTIGWGDIIYHVKPLATILALWGCELAIISPFVVIFLIILFPLGTFYLIPKTIIKEMKRGKKNFDGIKDVRLWIFVLKLSFYMPLLLILSFFLTIGTFFTGFILTILFFMLTCIKMIPPVSNAIIVLDKFSKVLALLGIDMACQLIQAAKQDRILNREEEDLRFTQVNPV